MRFAAPFRLIDQQLIGVLCLFARRFSFIISIGENRQSTYEGKNFVIESDQELHVEIDYQAKVFCLSGHRNINKQHDICVNIDSTLREQLN